MAEQYNPFASVVNPNMRQTSLWDLRMMSAANRSETPFERGVRGMYSHQGMRGDPSLAGLAAMSNEPDYSQFTYDPAARTAAYKALSPYGLHPLEANEVKQNVLLPNSGFFGDHPRLSAGLEGGIFGALAAHGGETPGESIQGALEGLVGGQRMRQGLYRQQFARPFEAAGMMEGLRDTQQKRDLQEAEIQHMRAENIKLGRPEHDYRAMGQAGPQDRYIPILNNETGQMMQVENPNYDRTMVQMLHRQAGAGTDFDRFVDMRNQERKAKGQPPLNSQEILGLKGQWSAAPVGPGESARLPYQNYSDARKEHDKRIDSFNSKMLKSDDPAHMKNAKQTIMQQRLQANIEAKGAGRPLPYPNALFPTDQEAKTYIDQGNQSIQQQIDAENAAFQNQWPQAMEAPPAPRGKSPSSQQTGLGTQTNPIVIK